MSARSGVLAIGVGFCWQAYEASDGVEVAACYLERRPDGLRGLLRRDLRGWYVVSFSGQRIDVPAAVIDTLRGTAPYGARLLEEQAELAVPAAHRRTVRGIPTTVDCPDCGARVVVA